MASSIASRLAEASGRARSMPEISATKSGVTGLTVMLIAVSCGYSVRLTLSPRKRHAANLQARPARRLPEGSHAHGRLGSAEEARRGDHGVPRAVRLGRGCREQAGALRHAGPAARAHAVPARADRQAAQS